VVSVASREGRKKGRENPGPSPSLPKTPVRRKKKQHPVEEKKKKKEKIGELLPPSSGKKKIATQILNFY